MEVQDVRQMRWRTTLATSLAATIAAATAAAPAGAAVPHTVQPGETLWSIAAANNLHTNALAAFNGLSVDSQVVLGSTIQIPSEGEALTAVNSAPQPQSSATAGPSSPAAPAPG